jgi:hypothetical protein
LTLSTIAVLPATAQDSGYLKAYGAPADAGVWVNGRYVGPSHRFTLSEKYAAPTGEVEVTFKGLCCKLQNAQILSLSKGPIHRGIRAVDKTPKSEDSPICNTSNPPASLRRRPALLA